MFLADETTTNETGKNFLLLLFSFFYPFRTIKTIKASVSYSHRIIYIRVTFEGIRKLKIVLKDFIALLSSKHILVYLKEGKMKSVL